MAKDVKDPLEYDDEAAIAFIRNQIPQEMKTYIAFIEKYLDLKIKLVSVGPDRTQNIEL